MEEETYTYSPSKFPVWLWATIIILLFTMFFFGFYSLALRS